MATFGIEKLYVAKQTSDDSSGMEYTKPQYYKNVTELDNKPKVNDDQAYAENRQVDQATMFANSEVSSFNSLLGILKPKGQIGS